MAHSIVTHPAYPWAATIVGAGLAALGAALIYREPPADKGHMIFEGAIVAVGVLLLPGVAGVLAASFRQVGGSIAETWKARQ
jgi:hypothetical protein